MLNIVSWNIARRPEAWRELLNSGADIALLQEVCPPPSDVAERVDAGPEPWHTDGAGTHRPWRTAVVGLNPQVRLERHVPRSVADASPGELAVSRLGTLTAATAYRDGLDAPITVVSLYSAWERPWASTRSDWIYADASAHRLISDLTVFVGAQKGHRIIAAGDLNILYGHGEHGSEYWAARYRTIFDRMAALGIPFVGPQAPCGRQADPWPRELPSDSKNVPTYHTSSQTPETATRQLDFVFASKEIEKLVTVYAMNNPRDWGPSDHCRTLIQVRAEPVQPIQQDTTSVSSLPTFSS